MAEQQKIVGYDYSIPRADGMDNVTTALRELLNSYPGLSSTDEITFSVLETDSGKAMFPTSSVAILNEKKDITSHVTQTCIYPFLLVYRTSGLSENRKANVKEWLDTLGKWLEKQKVTIDNVEYQLDDYPDLTGDREFTKIARTSQSHLYNTTEDKVEDWAISIQATYKNEYDID